MLKVKTFDPNGTFGAEFGDPHFFLPGAHNIHESKFGQKLMTKIAMTCYTTDTSTLHLGGHIELLLLV